MKFHFSAVSSCEGRIFLTGELETSGAQFVSDRRNPPPPGGFLCWVVSKSRTRRKWTPLEEPPAKLINFGLVFQGGGVHFLRVFDLETTQQTHDQFSIKPLLSKKPPWWEFLSIKFSRIDEHCHWQLRGISVLCRAAFLKYETRGVRIHLVRPPPYHQCALSVVEERTLTGLPLIPIRDCGQTTFASVGFSNLKIMIAQQTLNRWYK